MNRETPYTIRLPVIGRFMLFALNFTALILAIFLFDNRTTPQAEHAFRLTCYLGMVPAICGLYFGITRKESLLSIISCTSLLTVIILSQSSRI